MDEFSRAAFWGLIGGFIYAGPRLSACVYASSREGGRWGLCALEFVVGVSLGSAASAAFTPAILAQEFGWLGRPGPHQLPAVACALGYAFHKLGPAVVDGIVKRADIILGRVPK